MKSYRKYFYHYIGIFAAFVVVLLPIPTYAAPPDEGVGVNLSRVRNWSPAVPYVDAFRQASNWRLKISKKAKNTADKTLDLTPEGWIKSLKPGQSVFTRVLTGDGYPAGKYVVIFDGEGVARFGGGARGTIGDPKKNTVEIMVKATGAVDLNIFRTNPSNPLRNIRMYQPGFTGDDKTPLFNPKYLTYLKDFRVIRFMDWANTNNSKAVEWENRVKPGKAPHYTPAVPYEHMIELAENLKANPWFTVPHMANDDYFRKFAQFLKDNLSSDRKFYIEYSNEVWNRQFKQQKYAASMAKKMGLKTGDDFYRERSLQLFAIFESVFKGTDRFVRVLAGQGGSKSRARRILNHPKIASRVDAYAIAPYVDLPFPRRVKDRKVNKKMWNDRLNEYDRADGAALVKVLDSGLNWYRKTLSSISQIAKSHGVPLIAYEGGQHIAVRGIKRKERPCHRANRDPSIKQFYTQYLNIWEEEVPRGLFVLFNDMSRYGSSGCWGLAESYKDADTFAPKLQAVREFMKASGQTR